MNESCDPPGADDLHTISAAGFSATVDAFARDERDRTLWFLSMVGSQTALKAIWAALLKQPPEAAHLMRGADGTALSGGYQRCMIPRHTVGTWTTKIARLPATGGWQAMVYTRLAEFGHEDDSFLLLAGDEREAPALHHRFLDRRSPPAPPPLLGRLALGQGHRHRRDRPATVGGHLRVPLQSRRREAQKRPVRGGRFGYAHAGRRRPAWIERCENPSAATGGGRIAT